MKKDNNKKTLTYLIVFAIVSITIDIIIASECTLFNEINRILFSLVTVISGFWVTCYLLFLQIYKDRYPLKFLESKYMPNLKYNKNYIVYCIIFGCFIIVKNGGVVENVWYAASALYTIFIILVHIYDASKNIMVNTYIDEFCDEIRYKLTNKENSIKQDVFRDIRYILDECIVKEEYYVVQNISIRTGDIFRDFLKNSIGIAENIAEEKEITDAFERIVKFGIYQLELCKDINSEILINEISCQQINNINFCIKSNQYEWFKLYIKKLSIFTFHAQQDGEDKVVAEIFSIYAGVLKKLIKEEKEEWIKYMLNELFSMTTSLNFLSSNINLKYFASLIVCGLLNCTEDRVYDYIYELYEDFTNVACRVSKGFSDIKAYYALYFDHIVKNNDKKNLKKFFEMIFSYGQDRGNDVAWTEFKFYCIKEILERKDDKIEIDVNVYHIKLLVEVIEMKEHYNGYMFLPQFEQKFLNIQYLNDDSKAICEDIRFLLNKSIINDNLNLFFILIKSVNKCLINTEARNKDLQLLLFDLYVWMVERTKRLNNKQFIEIVFIELGDMLDELDQKKAISKDFGDRIISELSELARHADSDSHTVVLHVIDLYSNFLKENEELHFVNNYPDRKERLYKGLFNIATDCIENDFEEGVRRCSNTIGWFTIYSIKQGNGKLTKYLIKLAKGMLEIAIDMKVTTTTQTFLLTLFTTVGMYCCKDSVNHTYIEAILGAIQKVDKNLVYTAIKIRTYENDMWDNLLEKNTQHLALTFKKKYEEHQKRHVVKNNN